MHPEGKKNGEHLAKMLRNPPADAFTMYVIGQTVRKLFWQERGRYPSDDEILAFTSSRDTFPAPDEVLTPEELRECERQWQAHLNAREKSPPEPKV